MKPGNWVSVPEKFALRICIRGIPGQISETNSADDRVNVDIAEVEALIEFLNIGDRKLVEAQRLGKYDRNETFPLTFSIITENPISRDLNLRAAFKLKGYNKCTRMHSI